MWSRIIVLCRSGKTWRGFTDVESLVRNAGAESRKQILVVFIWWNNLSWRVVRFSSLSLSFSSSFCQSSRVSYVCNLSSVLHTYWSNGWQVTKEIPSMMFHHKLSILNKYHAETKRSPLLGPEQEKSRSLQWYLTVLNDSYITIGWNIQGEIKERLFIDIVDWSRYLGHDGGFYRMSKVNGRRRWSWCSMMFVI